MKDPSFNTDMYAALPSFKFPVLIIHGESDVIPMGSIDRLKKGLPDARLILFKKSGHFLFLEETEAYNDAIAKFLE